MGGGGIPPATNKYMITLFVDLDQDGVRDPNLEAAPYTVNAGSLVGQPWVNNYWWWDGGIPEHSSPYSRLHTEYWGHGWYNVNNYILSSISYNFNNMQNIFPVAKNPLTFSVWDPTLNLNTEMSYPNDSSCGSGNCVPISFFDLRPTDYDHPYVFTPKSGENWGILSVSCTGGGTISRCQLGSDGKIYVTQAAKSDTAINVFMTTNPPPTPTPTPTPVPTPSCTVSLAPATATGNIGVATPFTATVTVGNGTVSRVNFSSSNTGVATVSPASDTASPYVTQATGVSGGTVTVTASVVMGGVVRCTDTSSFTVSTSSCTVSLTPASSNISRGANRTFTATVTPQNGTVSSVNFISTNPSIVSVNPASDTTVIYSTVGTGVSLGSTTVTSNVYMGGVFRCTDNSSINVTSPDPWWQVKDGDVSTNGDLNSDVPASAGLFFGDKGIGGYPGVPSYGDSTNLNGANVSQTGWLAASTYSSAKIYNSSFFLNSIPADTTLTQLSSSSVDGSFFQSGGTLSNGYYWYEYDPSLNGGSDLTINTSANLVQERWF
jgi:uncharacterized protein YjdB